MKDFKEGLKRQINLDHGLGGLDVRDRIWELVESLPPKLAPDPRNSQSDGRSTLSALEEMIRRSRTDYLLRWSEHVTANTVKESEVEVVARLAVAHLLDEGFNRSHVHGWLTNLPSSESLSAALEHAHGMLAEERREYELLVAIRTIPATVVSGISSIAFEPQQYLDAFRGALNLGDKKPPRLPAAAVRLTFLARDPHSAIAEATTWMRKFSDRVAVGTGGNEAVFENEIIDRTTNKIRSFKDEGQLVRVPSIQRNSLFSSISTDANGTDQIDDAIGLLAAQQQGTSAASIASAWAAVEALLGMPGAKGVDAADRLADIVACSFPRAELTALAARWEKNGNGALQAALRNESKGTEKARIMLEAIVGNGDPGFAQPRDIAAVNRIKQLSGNRVDVLARIRGYYRSAFRRLYYQRNFIMHAAKFDSVSLPSTTRSTPQLVAAGVDRIVNARFSKNQVPPLALASRAENELILLATPSARPLYSLLD